MNTIEDKHISLLLSFEYNHCFLARTQDLS